MKSFLAASPAILLWMAIASMVPFAFAQEEVARMLDDSWVRVEGTVVLAREGGFVLDYGDNTIKVEMDDRISEREGKWIRKGDNVAVYGRIDNDLFEERKIEASSVYVKNINTYFHARGTDEEMVGSLSLQSAPSNNWITVSGRIVSISGQQFSLATKPFNVDTAHMADNPLDNVGSPKLDVGDRVTVSGQLENTFFEDRLLVASDITLLSGEH